MFSEIAVCKTWECINSFASWISALGTILISGLALWLSWKDRLIRVKALFDYGLIPGENPTVLNKKVYILAFTNVGHRTVTITNYEWKIRRWPKIWRWNRIITFPYMDPVLQHMCSKFPVELSDGKEGHIFHNDTFFEDIEIREDHLFSSSKFIAFIRICDFKMVLHTTTGKIVSVHIPFRVRKNIWNRYNKSKT